MQVPKEKLLSALPPRWDEVIWISSFRLPSFTELLLMSRAYFYCENFWEDLLLEVLYPFILPFFFFFVHQNNINNSKQKISGGLYSALGPSRDGKAMWPAGNGVDMVKSSLRWWSKPGSWILHLCSSGGLGHEQPIAEGVTIVEAWKIHCYFLWCPLPPRFAR